MTLALSGTHLLRSSQPSLCGANRCRGSGLRDACRGRKLQVARRMSVKAETAELAATITSSSDAANSGGPVRPRSAAGLFTLGTFALVYPRLRFGAEQGNFIFQVRAKQAKTLSELLMLPSLGKLRAHHRGSLLGRCRRSLRAGISHSNTKRRLGRLGFAYLYTAGPPLRKEVKVSEPIPSQGLSHAHLFPVHVP
eukprot:1994824-Pyramimonas_sp.AAC.1